MGEPADLRHVGDVSRAVGHVRERDQRGPLAHRLGHRLGLRASGRVAAQEHQVETARLRQPLERVAVGREVVVVGDYLITPGAQVERRRGELVEADRGRVADRDLARAGAERDLAETVANRQRQLHPALVPPADQPPAPLLGHGPREALGGRPREPAERVAVQVDELVVDREPLAELTRADRPRRAPAPAPWSRSAGS